MTAGWVLPHYCYLTTGVTVGSRSCQAGRSVVELLLLPGRRQVELRTRQETEADLLSRELNRLYTNIALLHQQS